MRPRRSPACRSRRRRRRWRRDWPAPGGRAARRTSPAAEPTSGAGRRDGRPEGALTTAEVASLKGVSVSAVRRAAQRRDLVPLSAAVRTKQGYRFARDAVERWTPRIDVPRPRWSEAELLARLRATARTLGRPPHARDLARTPGAPSLTTLRRRFGSLLEARRRAGLGTSCRPVDEDGDDTARDVAGAIRQLRAVSPRAAADLLGVELAHVESLLRTGDLLALDIPGGGTVLPIWQFSGGRPLRGLRTVLRCLTGWTPWDQARFMLAWQPELQTQPVDLLRRGLVDAAAEAARRAASARSDRG